MQKFRKLKLFCLVSVLAVALVFIGLNLVEAQVKTTRGKPDKPPKEEVNWEVRIPDTGYNMLYGMKEEDGMLHKYVSNEKDWVSLVKLGYRGKEGRGFYYQINFWIHPPIWAGFQNVNFYVDKWKYDSGIPCRFPYDCSSYGVPYCLQCFLNNPHPHTEYTSFRIYFMICDFDIEGMEVGGDPVDLSEYEGHYGFSMWYSSECSPEVLYHNVTSTVGVPPKSPIDGLSIQRNAEDKWRIFVDRDMEVKEIYCEEETGKGRKLRRVYRTPVAGTAQFNFQIDWIKNIVK